MPGVFSKSNRPRRPGSYFNFEAVQTASLPVSIGSTVALGFTHDWGPNETIVILKSLAEFKSIFGPTETTAGFRAAKQAFQGEGLEGRGGAGAVVAYRMTGSAAAKSTKALQNTTPATALTLTAKYEGTYGGNLKVTVQDNAADAAKTDLILFVGSTEVERYTFTDADTNGVAAALNARSKWVTAVANINGVPLAVVTNSAFGAGNDGATLIAGDYTAAMGVLETQRFSLLAFENLIDSSILASLKTWGENLNAAGKRFLVVVGGDSTDTITSAVARAATLASENFITLGVGTLVDEVFGTLSTAQVAARVAGIMAAKGEARSATFGRMKGMVLGTAPTEADIVTAFDGGVTVFSRDSHPEAPVRIEKALTTYIDTSNPQKPYLTFRSPKNVRTMGGFQMEMSDWADANVIGNTVVNNKTRDLVVGEARSRLQKRVDNGVIQPEFTVTVDPDPAPSDDDEFVALVINAKFGRNAEQVFFTMRVG